MLVHVVAFMLKQYERDAAFHVKPARLRAKWLFISPRKKTEAQWNRICRVDLVGDLKNGLVKLVSRRQRVGCRNPCTPWCPQTSEAPVPCADLAQDYCVPTSDLIS